MKKRTFLRLVSCLLMTGLFLALLIHFNTSDTIPAAMLSPELIEKKGQVLLSGGEYTTDADGSPVYRYLLHWKGKGYLFFPRATEVTINGEPAEILSSYRGLMYLIEGKDNADEFEICIYPSHQTITPTETYIYFGNFDSLYGFDHLTAACNYFLEGFCAAVVFFSIVLMLCRPQEKYLHWLALEAFLTGNFRRMQVLFTLLHHSFLNDASIYAVINQLILAGVQFLLMREFMPVRYGKVPCYAICAAAALPALFLYRNARLYQIADIAFYVVLYFVYLSCFLRVSSKHRAESSVLLLAWSGTTALRALELFTDAGFLPSGMLNLLVRLRGLASVMYIFAFFVIVCKLFADKFNESDRLNSHLEQEVQEKSRQNLVFVRSLLHNMKTPLFSLSGYSDMASDLMETDPQTAKIYVGKLKDKALYLSGMVDQISLVTRMSSGVVELHPAPAELLPILQQCVDAVQKAAAAKDLRIECLCDPAAAVLADPVYLPQAIQNVLDNAVTCTGLCGKIELQATKSPDGQKWLLHIRDNGCGIAPENLSRIFDAYYSDRHGASASTGLGLYICREILRLHHGEVSVTSDPGHGADFLLEIPAV